MAPRKSKKRDLQKEAEILAAPVNMDGAGEDPAIKAMLTSMPTQTNLEALDIAVALQEIIRGQKIQGEELSKLRQEMARMDKNAQKWEEDRVKFAETVSQQADKLRMSEEQREKLLANKALELQRLTDKARAELTMDKKRFDEILDHEPKDTIVSPGIMEMVNEGGVQMAKIRPEVIRIKHRIWVLTPNVPTEVPHSVYERWKLIHKGQMETAARQELLQKNLESGILEKEMEKLDKKFNSSTERLIQ